MTGWLKFPADQYLDQRHPNWVLAEEFGDVKFSGDAVFVRRERAEHIVRALIGGGDVPVLNDALALLARAGVGVMRLQPPQPRPLVVERQNIRWRDIGAGSGSWLVRWCSSWRWRCRSMTRRCR